LLPKLGAVRIGDGPEYFHDFRSVPEAGRPREQVHRKSRKGLYSQVSILSKAELGYYHFLEIVTGWRSQLSLVGTFHPRRSHLLKTGFFWQVRELKIQGKIQAVLYGILQRPFTNPSIPDWLAGPWL
jgi:hypothetical protein